MTKRDFWQLEIAYWPAAVKAGVRPVKILGVVGSDNPAFYTTTCLDFSNPPSRAEFLEVVKQTSWMSVWEADLLPVIAANPWPILGLKKRNDAKLMDSAGEVVGNLSVSRQTMYTNTGLPDVYLEYGAHIQPAIRYVAKDRRDDAYGHVREAENRILETCILARDCTSARLLQEVKLVLREGGFTSGRPKTRIHP